MKKTNKQKMKVSSQISLAFTIIITVVAIIFYFLLPSLLNYPPNTINTQFDKEVSKLYYIYQYLIAMIFISKVKLSFFIKIGIVGLLGIVGLIIIAPYRMARIVSFLNPWTDPLGSGFQIIQSLYAIGPGGLFGMGFGNSIQKNFYLPEPQTDFIFSIISEELGFLGVLIVSIFFIFIFYRSIKISLTTKDLFGTL